MSVASQIAPLLRSRAIRGCVFDAYGTLFDFSAAVREHATELRNAASASAEKRGNGAPSEAEADAILSKVIEVWRIQQLEATWLRNSMGPQHHITFWEVTTAAFGYALAAAGVQVDDGLHARVLDSYKNLSAFGDAKDALTGLRAVDDLQLAILSNGSPEMLTGATSSSGLDALLDHVLSVEDVGVFKPDPRVYQLACDRLGVSADQILFVSSNGWDARCAKAFGMRSLWVNRGGLPHDIIPAEPDFVGTTLADLGEAAGLASRG